MPASNVSQDIGKVYGRLTILSSESVFYPNSGRKVVKFICQCSCGKIKSIIAQDIRNGVTTSCGCFMKEQTLKGIKKRVKYKTADVVGKKFNKLTIISANTSPTSKGRVFVCLCDCGATCTVRDYNVLNGKTISCGCARENIADSHRYTKEDFITLAKTVHGERYDYSSVEFVSSKSKVNITCKAHGKFAQTPANHLQGSGCRSCGKGFNPSLSGFLYILKSHALTKVGITNKSPIKRARDISNHSGITFKVVFSVKINDGREVIQLEKDVLKLMQQRYQSPLTKFDGYTECFYEVDYDSLVAHIKDITNNKELEYGYY